MASVTRDRFFDANKEVIGVLVWRSTLDGRTSDVCIARDGKKYRPVTLKPIGHNLSALGGAGKAHFNCRSVFVATVKSWQELGLSEPPPSTRSSMDGQVPDTVTYGEWLKGKDAEFQNDVLGKTKAEAFRAGMPIERFTNNEGKTLTIAELKKRDAKYFND
jgi:hypothetical protein